MGNVFDHLGGQAAKRTLPLLCLGVAVTALGAGIQVAQARGLIGPIHALGEATVFGVMSKLGGALMLGGLACGALRDGAGRDAEQSQSQPLARPLSSRARIAPDLAAAIDQGAARPAAKPMLKRPQRPQRS